MQVLTSMRTPPLCTRRAFVRRGAVLLAASAVLATGAAFAEPSEDASEFDLGAYKGKVVYLDFWASWCGPCAQSFPYMEELKQSYGKQGLEIIAVNVDHSRERADAFLNKMQSDLHVIYDPKGRLANRFKVKDMPTSMLIDRGGAVRYVHQGFFPEKTSLYDEHISELLHAN